MGLGYIRPVDRPAIMTLRVLALILAAALAVPAVLALARMAVAGRDRGGTPAHRRLEALWVAVPIALLAALVGFAVAA
jgi:heme/copper-type cytochrome/quinol oxidase subunit 2